VRNWTIHWSPEAREDLRDIVEFIAARDEVAKAERVFERLVARVDSLTRNPERGRRVPEFQLATEPPLLEIIERPWRIFYACEAGRVVIAAVIDGRREVVAALESRFGLGFPDIR
jgi:plasmid stabilization system protein ParE